MVLCVGVAVCQNGEMVKWQKAWPAAARKYAALFAADDICISRIRTVAALGKAWLGIALGTPCLELCAVTQT